MTDESNQTPWTERQWEEFFRERDVRSARYGELFETLLDHPDRDEIVDREMGWDREPAEPESDWSSGEEEEGEEGFGAYVDEEIEEEIDEQEVEEEIERKRSDLHALPAYSASFEWGRAVRKFFLKGGTREEEVEEIVARALEGSMCAAPKIAAGHSMGEDDDTLCGYIVRCKQAAAFAAAAIEALEELAEGGYSPRERIAALIEQGTQVRQLIEAHIDELRARVWWE